MKWITTLNLLLTSFIIQAQYDLKSVEKFRCTSEIPTEFTVYDDRNSSPSFHSLAFDFFQEYAEYDSRYWTISQYIYPTADDAFQNTNAYPRDRIARSVTFDISNPVVFYLRINENVTNEPRILIVKYAIQFSLKPPGRYDFEVLGCPSEGNYTFDLLQALYHLYGENYMYEFSFFSSQEDAINNTNSIPESEWSNYITPHSQTTLFLKVAFNEFYGEAECFSIYPLNLKVPTFEAFIDQQNLKFCGVPYLLQGPYDPNNIYQFSNFEWYFNGIIKSEEKDVIIDGVGEWTVFFNINNGCRNSMRINIVEEDGNGYIKNVRSTMSQVIIEPMNDEEILEYSTDGIHWQPSNIFNSTEELIFTFYFKNRLGCIFGPFTYDISNFFNFLSPNGDGINDTWDIRTYLKQTDAVISIFDRYGKLITTGRINEILPWNGMYNNQPLAVGSYWYKILLNDQLIKEGNILLKSN